MFDKYSILQQLFYYIKQLIKIIMMQTNFKYQYPSNNQKAVRYVLPANLQERYNQYDGKTAQILKQTEKCPFTSIRQLIIAFKMNPNTSTDLQLSDILREKYQQNPKLQAYDLQLNSKIAEVEKADHKLNCLTSCINQYNELHSKLQKKITEDTMPNPNNDPYFTPEAQKNTKYLQKQSKYFQFLTYSHELQRALVLISILNTDKFKPIGQNSMSVNNFRLLSFQANKIPPRMPIITRQLEQRLFQWREYAKKGGSIQSFQRQRSPISSENELRKIDELYSQMLYFSDWIKKDRDDMRRIYESDSAAYKRFLPEYTLSKQRNQIISNKSYYRQVIREEKLKLQNHLKKNYGMIVPYIPSEEYIKAISNIQNRELRRLLADELDPLQSSLYYVNGEYQKLYKDACDNRDLGNIRRRIQQNLGRFQSFEKLPGQDNAFSVHLIQSCRKLLRIVR